MDKITIIKLIYIMSLQYGIDPNTTLAVAKHESNFNYMAISKTNDYGVFQLNKNSFPNYTKKQLLNPRINIELGIKYLIQMKKICKYKKDIQYLTCYNLGVKYTKNNIKHPELFPYVVKVANIMKGY